LAVNRTTGNIYTGANLPNHEGIAVACIGSSGQPDEEEEEDPCDNVDAPTVTVVGDVLYSSEADTYQWYASGELLAGETDQSLVIDPVIGGVFNVDVTVANCSKSSADFEYIVTGLKESISLTVYPNPSYETIIIESDADMNNTILSLHTSSGQSVQVLSNISGRSSTMSLEHVPAGFYILSIQSSTGIQRIKIIKKN
jgi:hypothetical protein